MLKWLRSLFAKREQDDKLYDLGNYSEADKRALFAALATHPGFQLLCKTLHNQRLRCIEELKFYNLNYADSLLAASDPAAIREKYEVATIKLSTSIFWLGWLENRVKFALKAQEAAITGDPLPLDEED